MAKKNGGKQGLLKMLQGITGKISPEMVSAAKYFNDDSAMLNYLKRPSYTENYNTAAIKRLKTDEQINAEQVKDWQGVIAASDRARASAPSLTNAFSSALGAAAGAGSAYSAGNVGALNNLINTGAEAVGSTESAAQGMLSAGLAGLTTAETGRITGVANAKAQRDTANEKFRGDRAAATDARMGNLAAAKSGRRKDFLTYLTTLLSMDKTGSSGSGGSGTSSSSQTGIDGLPVWMQNAILEAKRNREMQNALGSSSENLIGTSSSSQR
jgi:hypothetical protein